MPKKSAEQKQVLSYLTTKMQRSVMEKWSGKMIMKYRPGDEDKDQGDYVICTTSLGLYVKHALCRHDNICQLNESSNSKSVDHLNQNQQRNKI